MRTLLFILVITLLAPVNVTQADDQTPPIAFQLGRGDILSVEWKPDGTQILVNTVLGAWIYTPDFELITRLEDVERASFSADGRYLAGMRDNGLHLWDGETFEYIRSLSYSLISHRSLVWHPTQNLLALSGSRVVSNSPHARSDIFVIDATIEPPAGSTVFIYPHHSDELVWSPDGEHLAGVNILNGYVGVWRLSDLGPVALQGVEVPRYSTSYGYSDGNWMIFWQDEHILHLAPNWEIGQPTLWDVRTGETVDEIPTNHTLRIAYSPDSSHMASVSSSGHLGILELASNEWKAPIDLREYFGATSYIYASAVDWGDDNRTLAFGVGYIHRDEEAVVMIIDHLTDTILHEYGGHRWTINQLRYSPDKRYLLSVDGANRMQIYDTQTAQIIAQTDEHTLINGVMAFSAPSGFLATADTLGNVHVWDVYGEQQQVINTGTFPVMDLQWKPHATNYLLTYDAMATIRLIEISSGEIIRQHEGFRTIHAAQFSHNHSPSFWVSWHPSGDYYAFIDEAGWIVIQSLYMDEVMYYIQNSRFASGVSDNRSIRWNADGNLLAIGGGDRSSSIDIFDWQYDIESPFETIWRHHPAWHWTPHNTIRLPEWSFESSSGSILNNGINHFSISPQGRYAIAISVDGDGVIWELGTQQIIAMLNQTVAVFWSSNERDFAIQRQDNSIWMMTVAGQVRYRLPARAVKEVSSGVRFEHSAITWGILGRIAHAVGGTITVYRAP